MKYLYPLNTTESFEDSGELLNFNGLRLSIVKFTEQYKFDLLRVRVQDLGGSWSWETNSDSSYDEALTSRNLIKFDCFPGNGFLSDLKTYEFTNLVSKLILLNYGNCPQIIYRDVKGKGISCSKKHHKYLNRKFVILSKNANDIFAKTVKKAFERFHSDKRIHVLLELFEITQMYGSSTGLRFSIYTTIFESFFVSERYSVKKLFARRLSDWYSSKGLSNDYFRIMYVNRSEFYHYGENKFQTKDEMLIMEMVQELIISYILDAHFLDVFLAPINSKP